MLKVSLLENALDYILDAAKRLEETEPQSTSLKYAIVHLWSGLELLLKKRLMDEHWSLIFRDINKAKYTALESGDFVSVYFDEMLVRLRDICGVDLDRHKQTLNNLREERNRLEHFQIEISRVAAISKLLKVWSFILDFCSSHLFLGSNKRTQEMFEEIRATMVFYKEFIDSRLNEISPDLIANEKKQYPATVVQCPECFQNAMLLAQDEEESAKCLFCSSILPSGTVMEMWLGTWNMQGPFVCLECGTQSLCRDNSNWICFCCGRKWSLDEFERCSQCDSGVYPPPSSDTLCEYCISSILQD